MQRRVFITTSVSAAAIAATLRLGTKTAFAQSGSNPAVYNSSSSAAAIVTGAAALNQANAGQWTALSSSLTPCVKDWVANNNDEYLHPYYASITPAQVKSTNLNQQQLLNNIHVYYPSVTLAQLQRLLTFLDGQTGAAVQSVISGLQAGGFAPYIRDGISAANAFAVAASVKSIGVVDATPGQPIHSGGGGLTCTEDAFLIGATSIAFAVLGVMTLGMGDLLVGAAWAAIVGWGGVGVGAWTGIHMAACGT
jgi:hypothetical protein